uniref:PARP catalytic domain-containing protein n=1 Tax=Cyprinus carpio TaxID=7962 RepID=A0A8C1KPI4_CYPCA
MGDYKYPGWRTYIIYHGTTMKNALRIQLEGFRCSYDGMLGPGVYPSRDKEKASHYPKYVNGQHLAIIIVRVRVAKVKRIDYQGHPLQKTLYQHGMVSSEMEEDCVYEPWQSKVLELNI